jgi:hypothetical protein
MTQILMAKYGVALTVDFMLHALDGQSFNAAAVHAAGDTTVMKDEGAETNTTNAFVDRGTGYSLQLTATEMQAARALLKIDDQTGPKAWLPKSFLVLTWGNASAHMAADLSNEPLNANVTQLVADATAATKLRQSSKGVISGTAVTGTLTTSAFTTDLTGADGFYFGRTIVWVGGALAGQAARIIRFESTGGKVFVPPMTGSPSNTDPFVVV